MWQWALLACRNEIASIIGAVLYNRICSMLEDNSKSREGIKYRLIQDMEEKLDEIMRSQNCSLRNIRLSHESDHRTNNAAEQAGPSRLKTCKKVMFQALAKGEGRTSIKKQASLQVSVLKSRKSLAPGNLKTYKSLNCSFALGLTKAESNKSNRSIRTVNGELAATRKLASQILRKFDIFLSTKISEKQIVEWLQAYCEKEHVVLFRLLVRVRKLTSHNSRKMPRQVYNLELDQDALHARLQLKLRDGQGSERYVNEQEMRELSQYLEKSFVQKLKIKTKQFEESIGKKLKVLCEKIRKEEDNEYILNMRKKPVEISDFLVDVNNFENSFGSLNKINTLNRVRFKVLNDADLVIRRQAKEINTTHYRTQKPSATMAQ